MCGVAAVIAPLGQGEREALVAQMCQLLRHRGPDGQGLWSGGASGTDTAVGVTLGHRRLAIVDLSPGGAQPMQRGELCISYNGEIYNHVELRAELAASGQAFHTRSDTEVLLAALAQLGPVAAATKLLGMFAFSLWDGAARKLWLGRDRFGKKPLYYLHAPARQTLLVASEPKAVLHAARALGLPVSVDRGTLACYLGDADQELGDATFFAEVKRVRPGELLCFDLAGGAAATRAPTAHGYYTLSPEQVGPEWAPSAEADVRFLSLFTDAVRLRLRSDVPVGACLSGGLDSSALVCVAAERLDTRLHTYSAVYRPDDAVDERRYIAAVVERARTPNDQVQPEAELDPEAFVRFLHYHDEPVGGASVWAQHTVFRLARARGCTVVLSGQGADESLTGYHGAFPTLYAELLRRGQLHTLLTELSAARRVRGVSTQQAGRALLAGTWALLRQSALPEPLARAWLLRRWRSAASQARFILPEALALALPGLPPPDPTEAAWARRSLLHAYLYRLLTGSSLRTILRYEDRNSMAASVESRAPFLDHRLVALCLAQPPTALVEGGLTKALLRRALAGILPELVRQRRDKIGFATPEARLLTTALRPLVADTLHGASLASRGLFDVAALRRDFAAAVAGTLPLAALDSYAIWKAVNVELWLAQHGLTA